MHDIASPAFCGSPLATRPERASRRRRAREKVPLSKGRARRVPAAQVEEWPGVTEAAPRAMPARDDGMKVVKSRRGHGAVSPETARANARKRREAQRRDEAGRNVFTGLDDAKEEAPPPPEVRRRKPEAPPPPPKDTSPKQKPPKARRKKAAADDGFVDYAGDLRERVAGVASILVMTCVWFLPALLYVLRTPHDFAKERFHAVPPPPLRFEILQPEREKLATSEVLEWRLSEDLTRRAAATTVGVEIWLDGTRLLAQNLTMPRAGKTDAGDLELSRLTYGLGHLQMGIHNVTVVLGSAERPPRFDACQNTSLFLSTTVGEPSRAAVPEAVPEEPALAAAAAEEG